MSLSGYDAIVVGLGSMGSATCWRLAQRGARVLGLDSFTPPHHRGSHGGDSRIVRQAYFEHPDYVPLLQRAYRGWDELADLSGQMLFERTGLLYFGPRGHQLITGALESSRRYSVPVQVLSPTKYPLFHVPDDYACLLEDNAGFVRPDLAITTMLDAARKCGAVLQVNEPVVRWQPTDSGVKLITDHSTYYAKKLVITAGAWGSKLLPQLTSQLQVTQQVLVWVKANDYREVALGTLPCWTLADDKYPGIFYGFPAIPSWRDGTIRGFKLAHHAPGVIVSDVDRQDPAVQSGALDSVREVLRRYFPGKFEMQLETESCRYTNSPDGDFIIDFVPGFERDIVYALGFSGHGFKFAPAIGEVLADLAIAGVTSAPIAFLTSQRLNLA
jgi:sarcosine oxidase